MCLRRSSLCVSRLVLCVFGWSVRGRKWERREQKLKLERGKLSVQMNESCCIRGAGGGGSCGQIDFYLLLVRADERGGEGGERRLLAVVLPGIYLLLFCCRGCNIVTGRCYGIVIFCASAVRILLLQLLCRLLFVYAETSTTTTIYCCLLCCT